MLEARLITIWNRELQGKYTLVTYYQYSTVVFCEDYIYPMEKVANIQVNLGTAELNNIKHILGSFIPIIPDYSRILICQ